MRELLQDPQKVNFYPRPPRGGRRIGAAADGGNTRISTHALREEGDDYTFSRSPKQPYFYPRPPRGGRQGEMHFTFWGNDFYPRPPRGGRQIPKDQNKNWRLFLPTPSARRATAVPYSLPPYRAISTHALREEGDHAWVCGNAWVYNFYPRPPRGGRHTSSLQGCTGRDISTHALREEGDAELIT